MNGRTAALATLAITWPILERIVHRMRRAAPRPSHHRMILRELHGERLPHVTVSPNPCSNMTPAVT